jgi:hypothetical protein
VSSGLTLRQAGRLGFYDKFSLLSLEKTLLSYLDETLAEFSTIEGAMQLKQNLNLNRITLTILMVILALSTPVDELE